jgi:hypothetical protein
MLGEKAVVVMPLAVPRLATSPPEQEEGGGAAASDIMLALLLRNSGLTPPGLLNACVGTTRR